MDVNDLSLPSPKLASIKPARLPAKGETAGAISLPICVKRNRCGPKRSGPQGQETVVGE
jgi:hypothetical protein